MTPDATDKVEKYLGQPRRMLIGGQWVESLSGEALESVDPATGSLLTTIPRGDATDVDRAVAAARTAFESGPWRAIPHLTCSPQP